jgi:flagellar hook-associated protein 1 FlgK
MGSLLTNLLNSANTLSAYTKVFNVIQNNISNANTPGYAEQDQSLQAASFDPSQGVGGGVIAGPLIDSRSQYLEQDVRNQQQLLGDAQQRATDLGQVQPLFDLTSTSGISNDLSNFFNSFSNLSVSPNDAEARQNVIDSAGQVAQSFNETAQGIAQVQGNVATETTNSVTQINTLASQIAALNQQFASNADARQDPGLQAQLNSTLESLSSIANYSTIQLSDGGVNVYLGGQTPLVLGSQQLQISAGTSDSAATIQDSQGNDITSEITTGSLGALIQEQNVTLPGYNAQLNTLAQTFADQVNGQLAQGVDQNGSAPTTNLFSYDQSSDAASTLAVTNITTDQIAAASASAPGGNGNALAVAQLATAPVVNGVSFTEAYGELGSQVGQDVSNAQNDQSQAQDLVTQAQQQRSQQSGVNLDTEAAKLLQFQTSYQAVGKMVTVLDDLTQTVIDMIPNT